MTTTTPDMGLVLPDVSITAGPQWATLLNAAFAVIDGHTHQTGSGVQISPAGLNISSDLTFNDNNATNLRTVRLFPNNTFTPLTADKTCLYALGGELFYIDASGNNVQITLNGFVDVAGAISALSIKDSAFFIQYFGDVSRQFRFNASAIPASTTRILSVPDSGANDSFVTANATQTLTAKTLTTPVISMINTGSGTTFTLPSADGTGGQVLATNGSAVLSFIPPAVPAANIAANDSNVVFTSSSSTFQVCNPTAARTYTMAATLIAGVPWTFYNEATSWANVITLQTSGSNAIAIVPPLGFVTILPLNSAPTTAAGWILTNRQSTPVVYIPAIGGCGTVSACEAFASLSGSNLSVSGSFIPGTVTGSLLQIAIPSALSINALALSQNNNTTTNPAGNIIGNIGVNVSGGVGAWIIPAPNVDVANVYVGGYFMSGLSAVAPQAANTFTGTGNETSFVYVVPVTF